MHPWPADAHAHALGGGRYSIAPKDDAIPPSGEVGILHTVRVEVDGDDVRLVDDGPTGTEHARHSAPGFLELAAEERARIERGLLHAAGVREVHFRAASDDEE